MANTRSNLVAARIVQVDKNGNEKGGLTVDCMFNPFEYTVSKSNQYSEKANNSASTPSLELSKSGPQTLKLNLLFDTYETGDDVTEITRKLWKFMTPEREQDDKAKAEPPWVAFEWGSFFFVAVITAMTQKFTLFKKDGTPVRAKVDVTFTQHKDLDDYERQNPTSGGGPVKQVWSVTGGDRLDLIAERVYGDPTKWRRIAVYNDIVDPLGLRPGQQLTIPHDS